MKGELGIKSPAEYMRNAGNDAYDGIAVLQAIMVGRYPDGI